VGKKAVLADSHENIHGLGFSFALSFSINFCLVKFCIPLFFDRKLIEVSVAVS